MIGYVSSAGGDGDVSFPEITVIYADDFSLWADVASREVYSYNRNSRNFKKVSGKTDTDYEISYGMLCAVVELLKLEETKSGMAMKVLWKDNFAFGPEVVRSEYLEGVWFPSPVVIGGCEKPCLNITSVLYDYTPSTLETSMLCDAFNMIFCKCNIRISAPFYCMYNSIFVSSDALRLFYDIFSDELFSVSSSDEYERNLKSLISFEKKTGEKTESVMKALKSMKYEEQQYSGTRHNFAINIKRSCICDITSLLISAVDKIIDFQTLIKEIVITISSYIDRFVTLSELLVVSENLGRANDIKFLTLYELMSAFAFSEKLLSIKTAIRKGKGRITHINKTKIPCLVYPDSRCIVWKE